MAMRDLALRALRGEEERFAKAPRFSPRARLDETKAARNPVPWKKREPIVEGRNSGRTAGEGGPRRRGSGTSRTSIERPAPQRPSSVMRMTSPFHENGATFPKQNAGQWPAFHFRRERRRSVQQARDILMPWSTGRRGGGDGLGLPARPPAAFTAASAAAARVAGGLGFGLRNLFLRPAWCGGR